MAPMNSGIGLPLESKRLSVSGFQVCPPSVVFHTPPPALAMKMVLASWGSVAIPVTRPLTGPAPGI
jgi:hypothetical protein